MELASKYTIASRSRLTPSCTAVAADADVELRCAGKVVAGATTNTNGSFAMELDMTSALAAFIGGCTLVVDTPLVKCNADLTDVGSLVSHLQGPLTRLLGGIFHLFPAGFSFHARRD